MSDASEFLHPALASRYAVESELGATFVGTRYAARDVARDRPVLVHVLRPELAAEVDADRLRAAAEAARQLQHHQVLPVAEAGGANGLIFWVARRAAVSSLRDHLTSRERMFVTDAVRVLLDVVDGLGYVHGEGLAHHGLSPDAVLLAGRRALVTDFGIARLLREEGVAPTPAWYAAPELADAREPADHRADLYAVGVLAYEMLTGSPPFPGATAEDVLAAQLRASPEPVTRVRRAVPPMLAQFVARCLAPRAEDRWQDTGEMLPQLEMLAAIGRVSVGARGRPSTT